MIKDNNELISFYRNKRVLITGHTGFKGSWLSLFLKVMGAEVFGISDERTDNSIKSGFNSSLFNKEVLTDINNVDNYKKEIFKFQPDLVFYLAAQPLVRKAYKFPVKTFETNVMGLTNFFNIVKNLTKIKVILIVTSDKVYEDKISKYKFTERDRLGGVEPYGTSKAIQEMIVKTFYESYFKHSNTKLISARAGNVLGGGDWAEDRLIVDIINSIIDKTKMEVRFPNNTRPWQYVIDLVFGYLLLVNKFYYDKIDYDSFNFAPQKSHPTQDILDFSKKYWGKSFDYFVTEKQNQIFEEKKLEISNEKIKNYTSWESNTDLFDTLTKTFDWYKAYMSNKNITDINKNIIKKFLGI